jgi:putative ABC transport system ATP-binding protein
MLPASSGPTITGGPLLSTTAEEIEEIETRAAAHAVGLSKMYGVGDARVVALDDVDVAFAAGEFTAIMGPSGSGKSTLLHCLAGLDTPTAGRVFVGDTEITALSDKALTRLRRDQMGFIFQSFNLLPTLTARENITLPADIAGRSPDPAWLEQIIDTVDLRPRLGHRPSELSGGQQQRVACARALAGRPAVIFADEPTGNLDSRTAADVLTLLRRCVHELGQTIIMVTHDPIAAAHADRAVFLADGRIVADLPHPTADIVLERMTSVERAASRVEAEG